jgi:hypothetical protein
MNFKNLSHSALIAAILIVYFLSHPTTVQTGDSGELVAAAKNLLVIHPPGYPLWTWINHAWLSYTPDFSSVFGKASIFSVLVAVIFYFITLKTIRNPLIAFIATAGLAFSNIFWKYSIIPEVFSLNLLFIALILHLFRDISDDPGSQKKWKTAAAPFVFAIGLSHHLTLVFLAPVILWCWWTHRRTTWFYFGALLGGIFTTTLYLSVLLMNTKALNSWAELTTFEDVLHHFLRSDYGSMSLKAGQNAGSFVETFGHFFSFTAFTVAALLIILLIQVLRKKIDFAKTKPYHWAIFASALFYILVFLPLVNFPMQNFGKDVAERFFLMPIFLLTVSLGLWLEKITFSRKEVSAFLVATLALSTAPSIFSNFPKVDLSQNHVIQDYANNYINGLYSDKPSILILSSDTHLFAIRYVQEVLRTDKKFYATTAALFVHPWTTLKVNQYLGPFDFDTEKAAATKIVDQDQLLLKNIKAFNFSFNKNFTDEENFKITYMPLGRNISEGKGIDFKSADTNFTTEIKSLKTPLDQYDIHRELFSEYAYQPLTKAFQANQNGNEDVTKTELTAALDKVPYCLPAIKYLCELEKKSDTSKQCPSDQDLKTIYNYY